jgi:hypothetical protein
MQQAQSFETDFWKDANLRKIWDDIVPGEPRKTLPYKLKGGDPALLPFSRRGSSALFRRGLCEDHAVWRPDRSALDPYSPDVRLYATG